MSLAVDSVGSLAAMSDSGLVTFGIGGKAYRLLEARGSERVLEALASADSRKAGRYMSYRLAVSPTVAAEIRGLLDQAAQAKQAYDSCTRTQFKTAVGRIDEA